MDRVCRFAPKPRGDRQWALGFHCLVRHRRNPRFHFFSKPDELEHCLWWLPVRRGALRGHWRTLQYYSLPLFRLSSEQRGAPGDLGIVPLRRFSVYRCEAARGGLGWAAPGVLSKLRDPINLPGESKCGGDRCYSLQFRSSGEYNAR
jgi:hypothetical protein